MLKGFVRLRSFSLAVAIPISIWNIKYSSPLEESIALNGLAKEGLKILAQTLAQKGIYRRQTLDMHPGKLSQSQKDIHDMNAWKAPHNLRSDSQKMLLLQANYVWNTPQKIEMEKQSGLLPSYLSPNFSSGHWDSKQISKDLSSLKPYCAKQ